VAITAIWVQKWTQNAADEEGHGGCIHGVTDRLGKG
jgi:hypothetical protein